MYTGSILATGLHITHKRGVVMVTWLFQNFAVCRDAARRAGLSATAELLVPLTMNASSCAVAYFALLRLLPLFFQIRIFPAYCHTPFTIFTSSSLPHAFFCVIAILHAFFSHVAIILPIYSCLSLTFVHFHICVISSFIVCRHNPIHYFCIAVAESIHLVLFPTTNILPGSTLHSVRPFPFTVYIAYLNVL